MQIENRIKKALLTDVENMLGLTLSDEQKEGLGRCFEITLGTNVPSMVISDDLADLPEPGDRVKLTEEYLSTVQPHWRKKKKDYRGTAVEYKNDRKSLIVQFDGHVSKAQYHRSFLQKIDE